MLKKTTKSGDIGGSTIECFEDEKGVLQGEYIFFYPGNVINFKCYHVDGMAYYNIDDYKIAIVKKRFEQK